MTPWTDAPYPVRAALVAATVALALGMYESVATLLAPSAGDGSDTFVLPAALLVLGLAGWIVAWPRLPVARRGPRMPRPLVAMAAMLAVALALLAASELVGAFADAGWIAMLDVTSMGLCLLFIGLGVWCAVTAVRELFLE